VISRRFVVTVLVGGVLLGAVLGAGLPKAGAEASVDGREATPKATLVLLSRDPITVAGRNFASRERVTVRVSLEERTLAKSVRASAAGRFTIRFAEASASECAPVVATATGRSGSKASTRKVDIPPPCGMTPQPGVPPSER
jgi:hypothetical protein